jgi:hypothetical protein
MAFIQVGAKLGDVRQSAWESEMRSHFTLE